MRKAIRGLLLLILVSGVSSFGQSAAGPLKNHYPRVVATFERFNQTAPISPVTIYTPMHWGTFRCSIVMVLTEANNNDGNAFWRGAILFDDGSGSNGPDHPFGVSLYPGKRNTNAAEFPFRAKAGKPIRVEVKEINYPGGTKYNIFVVLEQLAP
jgi:hypothetical protein